MNIPTEVLIAAVEALRAAETASANLEVIAAGAGYVIRDKAKIPGAQDLGTYDAVDSVTVELEALKDARRIVAVAHVLAKYERDRVWDEAVKAVQATYVPSASSVTDSALAVMKDTSKVDCVISGAQRSKDEAVTTVIKAMRRDKAQHGETGDIPLEGV